MKTYNSTRNSWHKPGLSGENARVKLDWTEEFVRFAWRSNRTTLIHPLSISFRHPSLPFSPHCFPRSPCNPKKKIAPPWHPCTSRAVLDKPATASVGFPYELVGRFTTERKGRFPTNTVDTQSPNKEKCRFKLETIEAMSFPNNFDRGFYNMYVRVHKIIDVHDVLWAYLINILFKGHAERRICRLALKQP